MLKKIILHRASFHADELTACALLKVFTDDTYIISRIPHQAEIPSDADFVIDIGRKYDGINLFDHHQREESDPMYNLSSAGLIWKYLNLSEQYPAISDFIKLIDENDVGIRKAAPFEYPRIIGSYNTDNIYDDAAQLTAFYKAMDVAVTVITSMRDYQDKLHHTEQAINNLLAEHTTGNILVASEYLIGWDKFLNVETTPHIRCLVWPKENSSEYQAQVIPTKSGEYGLHGSRFEPDESMTFVHSNGFFCVSPDEQTMLTYLNKDT